jgi:hypothetical protein
MSCAQKPRRPEPGSERMLKAARFSQFRAPEVLETVDLPDPHPGPGQVRIAVRAAGINPSDWKKRKGLMDGELPQTMGHEAAGVIDELGDGVADVAVGDRVFGLSAEGAAQAELTVLSYYAPVPSLLNFPGAAALPAATEAATRALDQLGAGAAAGCPSTAPPEASAAPLALGNRVDGRQRGGLHRARPGAGIAAARPQGRGRARDRGPGRDPRRPGPRWQPRADRGGDLVGQRRRRARRPGAPVRLARRRREENHLTGRPPRRTSVR